MRRHGWRRSSRTEAGAAEAGKDDRKLMYEEDGDLNNY